jgi:hypothetical protein
LALGPAQAEEPIPRKEPVESPSQAQQPKGPLRMEVGEYKSMQFCCSAHSHARDPKVVEVTHPMQGVAALAALKPGKTQVILQRRGRPDLVIDVEVQASKE